MVTVKKGKGARDEKSKAGRPSSVDRLLPTRQSNALKDRWVADVTVKGDGMYKSYDNSTNSHFYFSESRGTVEFTQPRKTRKSANERRNCHLQRDICPG